MMSTGAMASLTPSVAFGGTERFEIRSRIGEGAVGAVYEAFDRERGVAVALKALRLMSADSLLSLKTEFRSVQDLRHPNLVSLGELFEADGTWFFTMELVRGTHFTSYVRPDGDRADEARLRAALAQLVDGVRALHAAAKVHCDIKPSNVLVTGDGRVVV